VKYTLILLTALLFVSCSSDGDRQSSNAEQLGTIDFPVTGNQVAREHMERGIKLLHHMTYLEAEKEFSAAVEADSDCSMGYWGKAMTIVHPLWADIPSESRLREGWELIQEARARCRESGSARERAYIETLAVYFDNGWEREEKDRLIDLDRAWDRLRNEFPEDLEAASFFALFHLAPARFLPADKSYRIQRTSGLIVEDVLRRIPNHPGALHYQIHAYDFPALADRALDMCGLYGDVAPDNPHALHMPTHIYTRAGFWEKSIELNLRSAAAARDQVKETGGVSHYELHALDYAVYAYLQRGQYDEAGKIRDRVVSLEGPYATKNLRSGSYAFSAIPARCALEAREWKEAAQIGLRQPEWFPWDERFIPDEATVRFARVIGSVRSGDLDSAKGEIKLHGQLATRIAIDFPDTYWDSIAKAQQLAARAWLALAEGSKGEALALMRDSARIEGATEKEAVTPGEVLQASELLGDMLMDLEIYEEAILAYQAALERSPNRFYSLHGVGRAAEKGGDVKLAKRYYQLLVDLAKDADPDLPRLNQARAFLAAN